METTKDRLRRVLVESLRLQHSPESIPETGLRAQLGIDSVMGLEFLIWVENEFGIQIQDEDLSVELVDSLHMLAAYVDGRVSAADKPAVTG